MGLEKSHLLPWAPFQKPPPPPHLARTATSGSHHHAPPEHRRLSQMGSDLPPHLPALGHLFSKVPCFCSSTRHRSACRGNGEHEGDARGKMRCHGTIAPGHEGDAAPRESCSISNVGRWSKHKPDPSELSDETLLVQSCCLAPILSLSGPTGGRAPVAPAPSVPAEAQGESDARGREGGGGDAGNPERAAGQRCPFPSRLPRPPLRRRTSPLPTLLWF